MSIEVVPCLRPDAVDLRVAPHLPEAEVLHCSAAEWAEFVAAVKKGAFDQLSSGPRT
jgi:hypothetical protein